MTCGRVIGDVRPVKDLPPPPLQQRLPDVEPGDRREPYGVQAIQRATVGAERAAAVPDLDLGPEQRLEHRRVRCLSSAALPRAWPGEDKAAPRCPPVGEHGAPVRGGRGPSRPGDSQPLTGKGQCCARSASRGRLCGRRRTPPSGPCANPAVATPVAPSDAGRRHSVEGPLRRDWPSRGRAQRARMRGRPGASLPQARGHVPPRRRSVETAGACAAGSGPTSRRRIGTGPGVRIALP
jgi:hypothetical protein